MFGIFRSSDAHAPPTRSEDIDRTYQYWRLHIIFTMYVGYATFYFTRKSLNFAMPAMMVDLGLDKGDIGLLATLFYLMYGCSKFLSGVISDNSNPRYFMGIGLMFTGVLNIAFGLSTSLYAFAILWGLNAFFQGWGWPPCSKLLTFWYSRSERGTWWSIWNTAHNLGGALIPLLVGFCSLHYGWRYGFIVPGILGVLIGLFVCWRLRDKPSTMGLPSVGEWRNDEKETQYEKASEPLPATVILKKHILSNRLIWLLAFASVTIYVVRTAVNDWGNLYLIEVHGYDLVAANSAVSLFEVGGFLGTIIAGWGSDKIFSGDRSMMNFIFSCGILLSSVSLWSITTSSYLLQGMGFFSLGFFIFGPQMLMGMAAAENSHKDAAGAATGFIGLFAYVGAALAGYPVAKILEIFQWYGFFSTLTITAAASCIIFFLFIQSSKNKDEDSDEDESMLTAVNS